jgi:hypothetical protein
LLMPLYIAGPANNTGATAAATPMTEGLPLKEAFRMAPKSQPAPKGARKTFIAIAYAPKYPDLKLSHITPHPKRSLEDATLLAQRKLVPKNET